MAAIAIGMFAGLFTNTFVKGWMLQRLEAGVETEVSYIQVHHPKFSENYDMDMNMVELPPPLPKEAKEYVSDALGPRNFLWLKKGILAGTPQPGIVADLDYDLKALQRVGVTKLITLLEKQLDPEPMREYGIECLWFPIDDMQAPEIDEAIKWCKRVEKYMQDDEVIAYHCKGTGKKMGGGPDQDSQDGRDC